MTKDLEIFGPIFEQNANTNFEPIFEKSVSFGPSLEKMQISVVFSKKGVNFEHLVNGRWTHY